MRVNVNALISDKIGNCLLELATTPNIAYCIFWVATPEIQIIIDRKKKNLKTTHERREGKGTNTRISRFVRNWPRGILVFSLILALNFSVLGQTSRHEAKGDSYFDTFSFQRAISHYLRAETLTLDGKRRLAESYKKLGRVFEAERVYESILSGEGVGPDDYFNYISVLLAIGKYPEATIWIEKFFKFSPDDLRARSFNSNVSNLSNLLKDQGQYRIELLDINGPYHDFGPAIYDNSLVFASSRQPLRLSKRVSADNQPFLDIYAAQVSDNYIADPRPFFKNNPRQRWHQGPATFAKNGDLVAFTRSNNSEANVDGSINLAIFFAHKNRNGEWDNPEPFFLNNPEFSVGHPFLTDDGNTMYFVSNMPGGKGGADIYRIRRNPYGAWGIPENLGETINTEGDELFPFFHQGKGLLIYASNGILGLGGLDIFLARQLKDGTFSYPKNGGFGLNSRFDDFALIIEPASGKGYFSSNRAGGKGGDDIYLVDFLKPFIFGKVINGIAVDHDRKPVDNAKIILYDQNGTIVRSSISSESGRFEFVVDDKHNWMVVGSKEGFFDTDTIIIPYTDIENLYAELVFEKDPRIELHFAARDKLTNRPVVNARIELTNRLSGEKHVFFTDNTGEYIHRLPDSRVNHTISFDYKVEAPGYLVFKGHYNRTLDREGRYNVFAEQGLSFIKIEAGKTRLEDLINIGKIEFETYRHSLGVETIVQLEKVIAVLRDNPTMAIEIGSHTDCRGSTQLNQQLSERRAQAMAEYVRSRINNPGRVAFKGYGRTVLVNDCDCFLIPPQFCTEEQHAENRRTEFIIIRM